MTLTHLLHQFTDVTQPYVAQYQTQIKQAGEDQLNNHADSFVTFALLCKLEHVNLDSLDPKTTDAEKFGQAVPQQPEVTQNNLCDLVDHYFTTQYHIYQIDTSQFDEWSSIIQINTGIDFQKILATANYYADDQTHQSFIAVPPLNLDNLIMALNTFIFGGADNQVTPHAMQTLLGASYMSSNFQATDQFNLTATDYHRLQKACQRYYGDTTTERQTCEFSMTHLIESLLDDPHYQNTTYPDNYIQLENKYQAFLNDVCYQYGCHIDEQDDGEYWYQDNDQPLDAQSVYQTIRHQLIPKVISLNPK